MGYPTLYEIEKSRQMIDTFRGYDHNLRISEGAFFDMKNLTSDHYPVLSSRGKRGVYAEPGAANGLIAKDALCYVDGTKFVMNEYEVEMGLSDGPKQLISMGAYVIILPDKKYINTKDLTDFGNIENSIVTDGEVSITLCKADGTDYGDIPASAAAPESPDDSSLWIDTSTTPHVLKQYSANSAMWVQVVTTYVRISSVGIGIGFSQYDGVSVSGITGDESLNGSFVLQDVGDDHITVTGIIDQAMTQEGAVTVSRIMPEMDFVTECGNRLWGCRYGFSADGQVVNEIYASKLGDFKNWNCFMGISTDSWAGSVGTDGQFTGAITHLGYPLFFKENCAHKVYISSVGAHQVQDTACRGVQSGCGKSLAIVNEVLYYKSRSGIMAYDGSLPVEVSSALGDKRYEAAVAGALGNKYYVSMLDEADGSASLFVYDTAKGMWHREDELRVSVFCTCRGEMYAIDEESGKILTMLGSGTAMEESVEWMAQTGELGLSTPDRKYISRLTVRMCLEPGTQVWIYVQYDLQKSWEKVFQTASTSLRSISVPIRPKRCDFLRLRIEGKGAGKIYSITKTMRKGSELA